MPKHRQWESSRKKIRDANIQYQKNWHEEDMRQFLKAQIDCQPKLPPHRKNGWKEYSLHIHQPGSLKLPYCCQDADPRNILVGTLDDYRQAYESDIHSVCWMCLPYFYRFYSPGWGWIEKSIRDPNRWRVVPGSWQKEDDMHQTIEPERSAVTCFECLHCKEFVFFMPPETKCVCGCKYDLLFTGSELALRCTATTVALSDEFVTKGRMTLKSGEPIMNPDLEYKRLL